MVKKIRVRGSTTMAEVKKRGYKVLTWKKISPKMFELKVKKKKRGSVYG